VAGQGGTSATQGEIKVASYIYVVDERTNSCFVGGQPVTRPGEGSCMLLQVKSAEAMDHIVSRIVNQSEPNGIKVLRIMGHGYVIDINGRYGINVDGPGTGAGQLGAEGINPAMVSKFAPLKGRFAPGARIEFHTCKLGDPTCQIGLEGMVRCSNWLQTLADTLGVPVIAGEDFQYADSNWLFEGHTIRYSPTKK
jgi:hypothetical protein